MPKQEIEEFGRKLVHHVRDSAIHSCDAGLSAHSKSGLADSARELGVSPEALRLVVPDIVDEVVFALLHAIDSGSIGLKFVGSGAREADLTNDGMGELAGWYLLPGSGWRANYSKERFTEVDSDS